MTSKQTVLVAIATAFAWMMAVHAQLGAVLAALALTMWLFIRFIAWFARWLVKPLPPPAPPPAWVNELPRTWIYEAWFCFFFGSCLYLSLAYPQNDVLRLQIISPIALGVYAIFFCVRLARWLKRRSEKSTNIARISAAEADELVMEPIDEEVTDLHPVGRGAAQ
jgi:hypothetical protein